MDTNTSFFNGTDSEIATGSANFSTKISATPSAYGLTADLALSYSSVDIIYQTAYTAAVNPDTRTKGQVAAKNAAKAALKVAASDLAKIIDGTASVTDQQKIDLGLAVRKQPTPHPTPVLRPFMAVKAVNGRTISTNIYSDSQTKRGKPTGVKSAFVYTFAGTTYPSDPSAWQFNGAATKSSYDITLPDSIAGGTQVWICAAWVNGRGEAGPPSVPVSTFVQGGLSMAA